jgi:cytochrome c oxidase subunit 4
MSTHIVPMKTYFKVFGALMAGTLVTVIVAYQDLGHGPLNTVVALTIAAIKALLVVLWFMHLRWSSRLTWLFAIAGILWLALLIGLTMADFDTRGWS